MFSSSYTALAGIAMAIPANAVYDVFVYFPNLSRKVVIMSWVMLSRS